MTSEVTSADGSERLSVPLDPGEEIIDPGVHARVLDLGAADAPGDHSDLRHLVALADPHQRSSRVSLRSRPADRSTTSSACPQRDTRGHRVSSESGWGDNGSDMSKLELAFYNLAWYLFGELERNKSHALWSNMNLKNPRAWFEVVVFCCPPNQTSAVKWVIDMSFAQGFNWEGPYYLHENWGTFSV